MCLSISTWMNLRNMLTEKSKLQDTSSIPFYKVQKQAEINNILLRDTNMCFKLKNE